MDEKLKACPFCGSEDIEVQRYGTSRASCVVDCTDCHCSLESNEKGAGYFWNTRSDEKRTATDIMEILKENYVMKKDEFGKEYVHHIHYDAWEKIWDKYGSSY